MMEFRHVQFLVYIGDYQVNKIDRMMVTSSCQNPIDLATIEIPCENVEVDAIVKDLPVKIYMGYYDTGIWLVFSGLVKDVSWGRNIVIRCKDLMESLRSTKIVQAFTDAEPAVVMKFMLQKAGVADFLISRQPQPIKHNFILSNQSIIQAQRLLNQAWNLDWMFFREPEGKVVWQPVEETSRYDGGEPVLLLEYGKNILDLKPAENTAGTVTTFLLPFLRPLNVIRIRDVRYWASDVLALITKAEYVYEGGAAEMRMEWKTLAS